MWSSILLWWKQSKHSLILNCHFLLRNWSWKGLCNLPVFTPPPPPPKCLVKVKWVARSCPTQPHGLYGPWNSSGQNIGVGSFSLLQGIFPTQGSNPGLPHCRWTLYQLSHKCLGSSLAARDTLLSTRCWLTDCMTNGVTYYLAEHRGSRSAASPGRILEGEVCPSQVC